MNEFKRCMKVFTYTPFQIRLMLFNMIRSRLNNKSQPREKTPQ